MSDEHKDSQNTEHKDSQKPTTEHKDSQKPTEGAAAKEHPGFKIVGIGASAGGLAALKTLFASLPADPGAAFVVVVHLSPEHESHLDALLQPHCSMPVQQVVRTVAIEPNNVYLIPPGANLNTIDTHLRLSELEAQRRERAPIDHFFCTLADTHDGHCIGVILTGTGSDGTLGIRRVKEQGGLTLAQDPEEAEFDGMPRSAIASGMIDMSLPLAELPARLAHLIQVDPRIPIKPHALDDDDNRVLNKLFAQLRSRTGHDFSQYKRSTILRRIQRRMQLHQVDSLARYLDIVCEQPEEPQRLFSELLITVTEFFRDPAVFEYLEAEVLPKLFDDKAAGDRLRVWSVGCSTGEEAYSIAMLLLEYADRCETPPEIQVFASDLHAQALTRARDGSYPEQIASNVSAERLRRFFTRDNESYRVRKLVRETVVFAPHNLLNDPPFSHIDLVICRNLLIYLQRDVQRDVAAFFHYALRPGGLLLLGSSESLDDSELFTVLNKELRLYSRRNVPARQTHLPVFPLSKGIPAPTQAQSETWARSEAPQSHGAIHQQMAERYAPPSVLVNHNHDIVHASAHAGEYLQLRGGEPTRNLLKLAAEPLAIELRAALHTADHDGQPAVGKPVELDVGGHRRRIAVRVQPPRDEKLDGYFLVIFDELSDDVPAPGGSNGSTAAEVEAELDLNRRRLQAVIEEYEASREEMQATNEELQSTNEELRSTMEELETSKEELQSMNEELTTVNQENRHRVAELSQLSADLNNLLTATDIATLYIDRQLRIVRFTPRVGELFNMRDSDKGRPLSDLTHHLNKNDLSNDARVVLEQLSPFEKEIRSDDGRWFLCRILPYRTGDDHIDGVVLTFIEISDRKHAEEQTQKAREYAEKVIETLPEPLLVLTEDLRVKSANPYFYEHFQVDSQQTVGSKIYDLGNGQWNILELRSLLEEILPQKSIFKNYLVEHEFETLGRRVMLVNARQMDHEALILLGIHDVTDAKNAEASVRASEERLQSAVQINTVGILFRDAQLKVKDANDAWLRMTGCTREQMVGQSWQQLTPEAFHERTARAYEELATNGESAPYEKQYRCANGELCWGLFSARKLSDVEIVEFVVDITRLKSVEQDLRDAHRSKDEFLATLAHELRNPLAPVSSGLEVLREVAVQPEKVRELSATMLRQVQQLKRLVDDLMDVSRIGRNRLELKKETVDLRDVTRDAIEATQPFLDEAGHQLEVELPTEPVMLHADAARLTQALSNLLSNASKYTPDGGLIRIDLACDGGKGVLQVHDNGAGIPADKLHSIFEKFTQIEGQRRSGHIGLGLGLTLVKSLVEMHGGSVTAISAGPGQGSTFSLRLPLSEQPQNATAAPGQAQALPSGEARRILVVDDNQPAAETLGMVLEMMGHEARTAFGGEEALKAAAKEHPEIILLDIGMPDIDGYEVARRVRSEDWGKAVVLIALTGWSHEEDRRRTREAGFNHHMVKPVSREALCSLLGEAAPV